MALSLGTVSTVAGGATIGAFVAQDVVTGITTICNTVTTIYTNREDVKNKKMNAEAQIANGITIPPVQS